MSKLKKQIKLIKIAQIILVLGLVFTGLLFVKQVVVASVSSIVISANKDLEGKPKSFLLIGTDAANNIADSIIVVTINPKNSRENFEIQLTSVPRDTLAKPTCSANYTKINASYPIGLQSGSKEKAAECMVSTVSEFLNIPIDFYLQTDFNGVIAMVDAIDGVEIKSDYAFKEQDSNGKRYAINIKKGLQKMNGETALGYARQRYDSSDFERGLRQQQVIMAVVKKIVQNPTKYASKVSKTIEEYFDTNLSISAIANYASTIAALYNKQVENIANGQPVVILSKDTPYTAETAVDNAAAGSFGFNISNVKEVPFLDLYPEAAKFESKTMVKPIVITKNSTDMPSAKSKNNTPLVIEIQNTSIYSQAINGSAGYYGWIDANTLYYVSNMLRASLGLEPEKPNFDFSVIKEFDGPVLDKSGN